MPVGSISSSSKYIAPVLTNVVFKGDSLTDKNNTLARADMWATKLQQRCDATRMIGWQNRAVGGQTVATANANAASEIDTLYNPAATVNVAFLWMGINDIYNGGAAGVTADTVFARLKTWHNARQTAGFVTVAFTLTATQNPAYSSILVEMESVRQALNTRIRNEYNTTSGLGACLLIDMDADPILGGYNAVLNTLYYFPDQIHQTAYAQPRICDIVYAKLPGLPLTGNVPVGGYVSADTNGFNLANDTGTSFVYTGTWASSGGAGLGNMSDQHHTSNTTGAKVAITLTTDRFMVRSVKAANGCSVQVKVDGVEIGTYSLASGSAQNSAVVFDSGLLSGGYTSHTIELIKIGSDTTTTFYFDAMYWRSKLIENNASIWINESGTWNDTIVSTTFYRGTGTGSSCSTVGGKKWTYVPLGTTRVKSFNPKFSGGGTMRMNVVKVSDGTVVFTGDFNQNGATVKSGTASGTVPQIDSGILDGTIAYKVEEECVVASSTFDAIELEF